MMNRAALFDALAAAVTDGDCTGVLLLRTQQLREFERLFGYEAGEWLAMALQDRLGAALRSQDRWFRIGECDFAAVLPRLQQRQHAALAAAKVVRVMRQTFERDGRPLHANVAVGVATWPQDGADAATLCRCADEAATLAVRLPEGYAFNASAPEGLVDYDALHSAIAGNRLQTWLQPILAVEDDRLLGFESLSRWYHEGAWMPPARFVVTAEETGLIAELTHWCLHGTLRHCAPLLRRRPDLSCSVNLSPRAVLDDGLAEQIEGALRLWEVPPRSLKVEITETAFIDNQAQLAQVLDTLRGMGVGVSIDDYGTGYSSLRYLRDFPIDEIKIDRSFIADMPFNPRSVSLSTAVVELAHGLGAQAVAEGVEDARVLAMLREIGCDRYQGFLCGAPRPAEQVLAALA